MHPYFPYSQMITNVQTAVRKIITRHSYMGDWQVMQETPKSAPIPQPVISEIYY